MYERTSKEYKRQQMLNSQGATARLTYEKSQNEFNTAASENDILTLHNDFAVRLATSNREIPRASHHNPFDHGLTAILQHGALCDIARLPALRRHRLH